MRPKQNKSYRNNLERRMDLKCTNCGGSGEVFVQDDEIGSFELCPICQGSGERSQSTSSSSSAQEGSMSTGGSETQTLKVSFEVRPIETAPRDREVWIYTPQRGWLLGRWEAQSHHKTPRPYWTTGTRYVETDRDDQPIYWGNPDEMEPNADPTSSNQSLDGVSRQEAIRELEKALLILGDFEQGLVTVADLENGSSTLTKQTIQTALLALKGKVLMKPVSELLKKVRDAENPN